MNTLTITRSDGTAVVQIGVAWIAVTLCIALVRWRHSLLLGLIAAVALISIARAAGLD